MARYFCFLFILNTRVMEKRVIGIVLTLLGVIALIFGAVTFVNHTGTTYNIKVIATTAILGLIFFVAGIGIVRSTKDTLSNNEHIS
jgi:uncharacterized membrane protein